MKKFKKILNKSLFIILLACSNILLCIYYYLKTYIGDISFFQLYYHIENGGSGSLATSGSFYIVLSGILYCIPFLLILIIIEILIFTRWKKYKLAIKSKKSEKKFNILPTIFSKYRTTIVVIMTIFSLYILFDHVHYKDYLDTQKTTTDIYEKYYIDTNKVDISFSGEKRNLIYIYMESMESSLFSKKNNGYFEKSRIPGLEELAKENINFSNNSGLGGMYDADGYTISALFSSTSSTPIMADCENNCYKHKEILSKVRTIGDVLTNEGYNVEYIQGTDATFAGFKKYLTKHSKPYILDYNEAIKRKYVDKDYYKWWGIEDKKLFEISKKEITNLAQDNKPFAVTIVTMDTHFPDGYLDEDCKEEFDDKMSNAYLCSSNKVSNLVKWIKKQDFYDDTMIVITGDHKTMQKQYISNPKYERSVYNVFINSKKENVNTKNRIVTNFDMYPTVISGLGGDVKGDRIGFGTNLFSNSKTIPEIIGFDTFSKEKLKPSKYYDKYIK